MPNVLNILPGAVGQTGPSAVYGTVDNYRPAPLSFSDPLWVSIPSLNRSMPFRFDSWPAVHGSTLPGAGTDVMLQYDDERELQVIWWDGDTNWDFTQVTAEGLTIAGDPFTGSAGSLFIAAGGGTASGISISGNGNISGVNGPVQLNGQTFAGSTPVTGQWMQYNGTAWVPFTPPVCKIICNGVSGMTMPTTQTVIGSWFNTLVEQSGGMTWGSNGITVPIAGYYFCSASLLLNSPSAGSRNDIYIMNTSANSRTSQPTGFAAVSVNYAPTAGQYYSIICSGLVQCNAGDRLMVGGYSPTAAPIYPGANYQAYNSLSAAYVSPVPSGAPASAAWS